MKSRTSRRSPQSYKARTPRRQYRRQRRAPYSFLRRSGIATALVLLGLYAAMQVLMPEWPGLLSPDSRLKTETSAGHRASLPPAQLSGSGSSLHIYDGDTIAIKGQRIRFKGMDTPESAQRCELDGKAYACGDRATAELRQLIGAQTVTCSSEGRDKYKRILAYCKAGDINLNRTMVELGWAVSYGLYQREEADARKNQRGLWAGKFERPAKWRKVNSQNYNNRNQSAQ